MEVHGYLCVGVMNTLHRVRSIVRVRISLLMTTHEPPSRALAACEEDLVSASLAGMLGVPRPPSG